MTYVLMRTLKRGIILNKKIFVVVGTGSGIGNHVAEKFGHEGYHVVLMSRKHDKLDTYLKEFSYKNISVSSCIVDAYDENSIKSAFEQVKKEYKKVVDVLFYTVAALQISRAEEISSEELLKSFKVDVVSALFTGINCREVLGFSS